MTKVLVTGCAGFIGSTLVDSLLKQGYEVTGIDCFTDNYDIRIKQKNMKPSSHHKRFNWIQGNLLSIDVKDLIETHPYVFHQAALPGVRKSWGEDFHAYVEHNIRATQKLLEAVKNSNMNKLVYASSSSVYGTMNGPTSEEKLPAPYSPYGVTKLSAEHLCQLYQQNYGVPVISLRYFTVYGPRQRPDMAIHQFIKNILAGQPITIYGQGEQTRDFTYIRDAVEANIQAMDNGISGEAYNIGGGTKISVHDLIKIIETITCKKAKINYLPKQPGDAEHTWADITKARNDLQFSPSYSLEKGIYHQMLQIKDLYGL
ncbi:NAD-dependent epimerase/dehydratase family protein [Thalassobacillus sp. C254]|uniref:NAD-dependent epimerase/dehydratase family protein n=1 Tax=Thalassobacillus sp. C254 TaxID=1225341 RepID=UPI0006CFB01F|nr:NAD-dependent epimerase/dehydratase family protein [Thalassobacillus sp. C254]